MPDPITGAGFDAPPPEDAYKGAPTIVSEATDLLGLTPDGEWHQGSATAYRDFLLRRAALADRIHLDEPNNDAAHSDAVRASQELIRYDRSNPRHVRGPIGPGSFEWDPSARPYVRQEYAHRDVRGPAD
ncbi:hypothetical protein [Streptomyces abikoensis]